jgi:hypothetical protein
VNPHHLRLLKIFDDLPLTAAVPIQVAAAVDGVSEKTIERTYKTVRVSDRRKGVLKKDIVQRRGAAA